MKAALVFYILATLLLSMACWAINRVIPTSTSRKFSIVIAIVTSMLPVWGPAGWWVSASLAGGFPLFGDTKLIVIILAFLPLLIPSGLASILGARRRITSSARSPQPPC